MNTIEKLAPCPFCGSTGAQFERIGTTRQSCIVACNNCGARHESSDEGLACGSSWNDRAKQAGGVPAGLTTEQVYAIRGSLEAAAIQIWGVHFVYSSADERIFSQGFRSGWGAREHPTTLERLAAPTPPAVPRVVDKSMLKRLVTQVFGEEFQITRVQPLSEAQPEWAMCESRGPWARNGLKEWAKDLRDKEKRCRNAYTKSFMGEPARYVADACGEAAAVLESKLAGIVTPKEPTP